MNEELNKELFKDADQHGGLAVGMREFKSSIPRFKYREDSTLKEVEDYIASTYGQHYASGVNKVQTFDAINEIDGEHAWRFYRNCAIKYLWRLGKKQGFNHLDLLKAMHYLVLVMYMTRNKDEELVKKVN